MVYETDGSIIEGEQSQKAAARLLWIFLAIALFSAFFAPPLSVGPKKVFPYDLLLFFWPFVVAGHLGWTRLRQHLQSKLGLWTLGMILVLTVTFLHGQYRIDIRSLLEAVESKASDNLAFGPFSWIQDGILYVRFVSWTCAIAATLILARQAGKYIHDTTVKFANLWMVLAIVEVVIATLGYFTFLRRPLGMIYGYDPDYLYWSFQFHGTQSSPMECALLLAPALLWAALRWKQNRDVKILIPMAILMFGLLGAKSLTLVFALIAAWCVLFKLDYLRKNIVIIIGLFMIGLAASIYLTDFGPDFRYARDHSPTLFRFWNIIGAQGKAAHLVFRFQPWIIFVKTVFSRFDFGLFGLGFARSHSDNGYIQLLRTGGIVLLGLYLTITFRLLSCLKKVNHRLFVQWCLGIAFILLISAFTTDSLIYRSGATAIMLALALGVASVETDHTKRL